MFVIQCKMKARKMERIYKSLVQLVHIISGRAHCISNMYPPSSGRHAMRSLYGIGRDSWVWEMSRHALASLHSSHGVGAYSVFAVWPLAGVYSGRPRIILLLGEGVGACASRLSKMLTLANFGALA